MSSSHLLDPFIISYFGEEGKSYFDIACGYGKWGYLMKISHVPPSSFIGGDTDANALKFTSKNGAYDGVIILDARHLPFRENCFDKVLAVEVIEHLEKSEAKKIILEAERIAKRQVIVTTPLLGAHYWYRADYHISKWTPGDLRKLGYKVRGVGFSLFGRWSSKAVAYALGPLSFMIPWLSHILLAWKDFDYNP